MKLCQGHPALYESILSTNNQKILLVVVLTTTSFNLKIGICLLNNLIDYKSQVFTIVWDCKRHTEHKVICIAPTFLIELTRYWSLILLIND